jgi:PIN domain nuclease of toxin-antitoxin system
MRLLLDTHVAIWWLSGSRRLSASTRREIEDASNAYLSAVSLWEIFIKQDIGRLELPDGFVSALRDDFTELALTIDHAVEGRALPLLHRDPFDRMLVAQARAEGLTLVSADRKLSEYGVPVLAA